MARVVPLTGYTHTGLSPNSLRSDIRASPQPTKPDAQDARWLGDSTVKQRSLEESIEEARARIANLDNLTTFTTGLFVAQKPPYTVCFLLVNDARLLPRFFFCWVSASVGSNPCVAPSRFLTVPFTSGRVPCENRYLRPACCRILKEPAPDSQAT